MRFPILLLFVALACRQGPTPPAFDPSTDLLALHYDHAPDRDDGQSAVADRVILESELGADWMVAHVLAVSGAYGENASEFNPASDSVMDAVFGDVGGWVAAHTDRSAALQRMTARWAATLDAGHDVRAKEGGQSDLTAEVVRRLLSGRSDPYLHGRVHVVQHSDWNEDQTTDSALACTKANTDYIRISDANAYLNVAGGNSPFVAAARAHLKTGPMWEAAFAYYPPSERLEVLGRWVRDRRTGRPGPPRSHLPRFHPGTCAETIRDGQQHVRAAASGAPA